MGISKIAERLSGLSDIRMMASEVMTMNQSDMEAVIYDSDVPVVIRRIAQSLLNGGIREMATILDQALGKPVERHMVAAQHVSPLEGLTTDELRVLLAMGNAEGGDGDETESA